MPFPEHSCVRLTRAVPEHGLVTGALGTVVGVWIPGDPQTAYEVEFIDGVTERTVAVLTLADADLRPA